MKDASPERCEEQAAVHRRMAEQATDPETRLTLLRIAESYEQVAETIRRRKPRFSRTIFRFRE